jgi:hypothetical protein
LPEREYTAAEVDAAVERIADPARLKHAQDVVAHLAPQLQRILGAALAEGQYFGNAHEAEVRRTADLDDLEDRVREVRALVAEETRLGMLVGVAVGFELAHELQGAGRGPATDPDQEV